MNLIEKYRKIVIFIFGDNEQYSLEHRLFLSSIVIGILTSVLGSAINLVLTTSVIASVVPLILSMLLLVFYYFARFRGIVKPFILPLIITAMFGISLIWIYNGGINGSNSMPSLVIFILALGFVSDRQKKYILALFLLLNLTIYLIQFYRSDLITSFPTETQRWIDAVITITYCSIFIYLIISFLHKNYRIEKQKAEESEKRYRAFIETANEGVLVAQGANLKYVNPMVSEVTGFSEEELLSIPFIEFIHPDDRELMRNNYIKRLNNQAIERRYPIRILTKHKGEIWVEMSGVKIDWYGQPATLNFVYDITERRLADKEIQEKTNQLQIIIDNLPANIYFKNEHLKYQFVNKSYSETLKLPISDIIGKSDYELKLNDYFEKIDRDLLNTKKDHYYFEFEETDEEKGVYFTSSTKVLYSDDFGNNGIIGIVQDISEKKKAELALLESELQFKNLFENAADAVFIADKETGIILDANRKACDLLKMPLSEIIGLHQTKLHPPETESISRDTFHKQKMNSKDSNNVIENKVICSDNSTVPVEILASLVTYRGVEAVMGTFRDITERKRSEKELHKKNQELAELNSSKDKFFSLIAHDLKNPLGSFKDVTKLLAESYDDFSEIDRLEFLNLMKESSQNIYELLENLLDWSRSQRGHIKFDPIEFNLKILTIEVVKILKNSAEKKAITIENLIPVYCQVTADINMIQTIIRNLISNALKFTPENGKVTIEAEQTNNDFLISITDTGVGMDQETIDRLFRVGESKSTLGTTGESGTGLGLILCKEFVEKHCGKIWVESEKGKGCTFYFTLPANSKQE